MKQNFRREHLIDGIRLYAEAEKSDPFAFARGMSHLKSGVCSVSTLTGEPGFYEATRTIDADGVARYTGLARP